MFIDLVAVELLRAHLRFGHAFCVTKHYCVVLADSTNDIGLRAGADPDKYLVGLLFVDDLEVVGVASRRYDSSETLIILELFAQIISYVLGCNDNDSPSLAEDLSNRKAC